MSAPSPADRADPAPETGRFSAYEQPSGESPDIQEIHRAVLREQFEPSEGQQRVPLALFMGFLFLAMWAGYYLSEFDGNFQANVYDGPDAFRTMDMSNAGPRKERVVDPVLLGKRLFNACTACHQTSGEGIPGQYPPLRGSEWVAGDPRILARILLGGLQGPVTVLGKSYNAEMPAWNQWSDRDISAVLTYIRQAWGNGEPPVSEATISAVRAEVGARSNAFTAVELQELELPDVTALPASEEGEGDGER
ncbi:Cytochrome c-552 precursor [Planctomycetes bacterium Poly30]|uniref:Cytochrome c-552 n=1 Tax=Saltatorellus ferox TaxID=2528018 RepID=A0A518EVJ8_9BACT|nr:Cytochrome c-552 precursor [Planctomycetes bacterium Poly30]